MAGLACGNIDDDNDFYGMAPLSSIAFVKLKDAKNMLKDFYGVERSIVCYQENDILTGVNYLVNLANSLSKPLVICIGLGTNMGDHNGYGFLGEYLGYVSTQFGRCVCVAAGNEANVAHHYRNKMLSDDTYQDVLLRVGPATKSFTMQMWTNAPDVMSVGFISPIGEIYDRAPARINEGRVIRFTLEPTIINLDYFLFGQGVGDEQIDMRFVNATSGIWTIRIFNESIIDGTYDIWLPVTGLIPDDTVFLNPDYNVTVTEPGNNLPVITSAGYNYRDNSIYINSGRGNTRSGYQKPDITAGAVDVTGPANNDRYTVRSGTSAAAAITAGAAALVMEWAIVRENYLVMNGVVLRKYMIRGARRSMLRDYPNTEWGYGTLDIYNTFINLVTGIR